jgi:hypothetical protein
LEQAPLQLAASLIIHSHSHGILTDLNPPTHLLDLRLCCFTIVASSAMPSRLFRSARPVVAPYQIALFELQTDEAK